MAISMTSTANTTARNLCLCTRVKMRCQHDATIEVDTHLQHHTITPPHHTTTPPHHHTTTPCKGSCYNTTPSHQTTMLQHNNMQHPSHKALHHSTHHTRVITTAPITHWSTPQGFLKHQPSHDTNLTPQIQRQQYNDQTLHTEDPVPLWYAW